jgi:hypothetical protein
MTITQEQLIQLSRIYNTLLTVETRGENTLVMADCVRAFETVVKDIQKANSTETVEAEKVED